MTKPTPSAQHFQPWIGKEYGTAALTHGKRVMILGESHYEWLDNQTLDPDWTTKSIEIGIKGKNHRFRTRVMGMFLGHAPALEAERRAFWDAIMFTNYIPVSVGKGANADPSEEMWEAAVPRFAELITAHTPDLLVVLGHALWQRMHYTFAMDGRAERHQNNLNEWRTWRYRYSSGATMLACATKHPSRSFNYRDWHPFVQAMLSKAGPAKTHDADG